MALSMMSATCGDSSSVADATQFAPPQPIPALKDRAKLMPPLRGENQPLWTVMLTALFRLKEWSVLDKLLLIVRLFSQHKFLIVICESTALTAWTPVS